LCFPSEPAVGLAVLSVSVALKVVAYAHGAHICQTEDDEVGPLASVLYKVPNAKRWQKLFVLIRMH
jgi:hypothetical protein